MYDNEKAFVRFFETRVDKWESITTNELFISDNIGRVIRVDYFKNNFCSKEFYRWISNRIHKNSMNNKNNAQTKSHL